jgi:hypothetical protein
VSDDEYLRHSRAPQVPRSLRASRRHPRIPTLIALIRDDVEADQEGRSATVWPTMARAHWHHHEGPQSRDYLNSESRLGPHWNPSTLVRGGLDGGGHTHSKGDVALHRHHGHRELDLRGRREKAGDGIEVSYPPGAPLYSPSRRTVCGSGTSDQPSMAKGASRAGQAPLQYPQRASGGCMMAVAQ